jgi:hypothetical protein
MYAICKSQPAWSKHYHKQGQIILTYRNASNEMKHVINLNDDSIQELKFFICSKNTGSSEMPISFNFNESKEMSFLALQIAPNDQNGLSQFKSACQAPSS